jgi:hypothetical protein
MDSCTLPDLRRSELFEILKQNSILAFIRRIKITELLEAFEKAGIRAVLLKGFSVALYYKNPDSRISTDTDIYIEAGKEKKAVHFLKQQNFKFLQREKCSHHSRCYHPDIGLLELHTSFYGDIIRDIWFNQKYSNFFIKEPYLKSTSEDGTYYTLGRTDNLIFLALHMIKHFIQKGMSLRLIMDFSLYLDNNKNYIDTERFWNMMDELQYSYLIKIILNIAVKYFNFNFDSLFDLNMIDSCDITAVIDDIESGGWLGKKENSVRNKSWQESNRLKFFKNKGQREYNFYMFRKNIKENLKALFLSKKDLAVKFPYVKKSNILIPVALIHRLITKGLLFLLKNKFSFNSVKREIALNESDKKRLILLKKIKLI